jgi:SAM-dependent methyltransferase
MTLSQNSMLPHVILERPNKCYVCGATREAWRTGPTAIGSGAYNTMLFRLHICANCGLGITDPVPSQHTATNLYADRQSNDFQGDDSGVAAQLKSFFAERDVRTFLATIAKGDRPLKVLDYGCGNGDFARAIKRVLPEAEVWASDYHEMPPQKLMGSAVRYVSDSALSENEQYDFILCRHVLEHVYEPILLLRRLDSLLRPGGTVAIEVPNLNAPLSHFFKRFWDGYYAPFHPLHFTRASLISTISSAGLVVERSGGCEMPKIGRSVQNILRCRYSIWLFGLGAILHPFQILAGKISGEPTCLRIWALKP